MKRIWLQGLFFILANALLFAFVQSWGVNNLFNNQHWLVEKQLSLYPLQGSQESVYGRSILAGGRMHLDADYGFQEIRAREDAPLDRLEIRFHLDPEAYLDLFYGGTTAKRAGLRFSAGPEMPGARYHLTPEDQFVDWVRDGDLDLQPGWHHVVLREAGPNVELSLDGKERRLEGESLNPHFALRGGLHPVSLAKVRVFRRGQLLWQDDFWALPRMRAFLPFEGFFFLSLFFLVITLRSRSQGFYEACQSSLRWQRRLFVLGALWFCFDFFYDSRLPVAIGPTAATAVQPTISYWNFEGMREVFFMNWGEIFGQPVRRDLRRLYQRGYIQATMLPTYCDPEEGCRLLARSQEKKIPPKGPHELRLLMLGGSLYQGAGVPKMDQPLFARLWRQARERAAGRYRVVALNVALAGDTGKVQIEKFLREYRKFSPDLILTGFMFFETDDEMAALEKFFRYTSEQGIPVLYLERPYNPEYHLKGFQLLPRTTALRQRYGIPQIDLNRMTYDPRTLRQGILWWDGYHLTPYGESLLAAEVEPLLEKTISRVIDAGKLARAPGPADENPSEKIRNRPR